jgi:predicted dehydrogenase
MVNLGLIGLGTWGKNVLRNFESLPDCKVLLGCDSNPDQIKKVQPNHPGINFTHKMEEVLEHKKIDAVVIVTPPASHFELAKQALLNDKDVFVEKPMVLEIEKGKEILELSQKKNKILMVGHIMEYHPAVLKLKELISKGELGKIYYLYAIRVNLGKVRDIENALWSFAPHDISMILYLLDQEPLSVSATGECYIQRDKGIEDVVFMTMHFENGVMAHIHVSWLDPHKERKLTIVGDKKMVVLDDMQSSEKIRIYDKGAKLDYSSYGEFLSLRSGDILIPKLDSYEPLKAECQHFLECVKERKTPRSDGKDGLRVLKVLAAAQKSLEMGGTPLKIEY